MTKENQQHRRLIHKLKQDSAGFGPVLAKHRRHFRLLCVWIGHRQRHAHLRIVISPVPARRGTEAYPDFRGSVVEGRGNYLDTTLGLPAPGRPDSHP